MATLDSPGRIEHDTSHALRPTQRFWRNPRFARLRHRLLWLRRSSPLLTRAHARLIRWTGGGRGPREGADRLGVELSPELTRTAANVATPSPPPAECRSGDGRR
jgi:hypothetical protein